MNKLNILIVDDDIDYRISLSRFLELERFSVKEATSVNEAQEFIDLIRFDLVLVDLRLTDFGDNRDISGFDVAKKAVEEQIPCIIITAFGTVETATQAMSFLGAKSLAVAYVQKQKGPDAILSAIHNLYGITLLHISDLHPSVTSDGEVPFDQHQAYEKFLSDVQQQPGLALNPIQAIVVSGDISDKNKSESYNIARQFLENLSENLGNPKEQIILTPGNHDLNRKKAQEVQDTLKSIKAGDNLWFQKFDEYLDFTRHFYKEPAFSINKLYRIFVIDNRIAVIAFNSCLVEGDLKRKCKVCDEQIGKEHYAGWIDRHQIEQASDELDSLNWKGLRIATFHHHVVMDNWRPQIENCQGDHLLNYRLDDHFLKFIFSEKKFSILLHGHRHKVELRQPSTLGANESYNLGSGTFWTTNKDDQETANYLLLQLSPVPGKSKVMIRKYHSATSDRPGYWGPDDSVQPDGIIPLPNVTISSRNFS